MHPAQLSHNIGTARRVSVRSSNPSVGKVEIDGSSESTITSLQAVLCKATPFEGYAFRGWFTPGGEPVSNEAKYTYLGTEDASLVAYFSTLAPAYPDVAANYQDKSTIESYAQFAKTISVTVGSSTTQVYSTEGMPANFHQTTSPVAAKAGSNVKVSWTGSDGLKYLYVTAWLDDNGDGTFSSTSSATVGSPSAQSTAVINGSVSIRMPPIRSAED